MIYRFKLDPNERLLIESPVNRYKIAGPGRVWLKPRQRALTKIYVGLKSQSFEITRVRSLENIPLNIKVQVLYRADPELFTLDLLSKLPVLNDVGWSGILNWQSEYVLRSLVASYAWQDLARQEIQNRLERQLLQTLADRVKFVGLTITATCLVRVELPEQLQQTLIKAEEVQIEAQGRAAVLRSYLDIFGDNLTQAMPHIIRWELLNTIHRTNPQVLLSTAGFSTETPLVSLPVGRTGDGPAMYQIKLPLQ